MARHPDIAVLRGDARALPLPDASVDLVVTSPPYWGQRVYQDNGGAVDGQIGREATPAEFVDTLVDATREWVRVLRPTGSLWVNLGDRYADRGLAGTPWRYAIACTDTLGLTLRAEVIWAKPSGLPESVSDRVVRAHETWLHLTASATGYYADVDAVREPRTWVRSKGYRGHKPRDVQGQPTHRWTTDGHPDGKVPGSVWTIPTEPLRLPADLDDVDVHTAAMPTEWPRRIISGWCPPGGTVLDPFGGTGTVAHVAAALGRRGVTVDLSAAYCRFAAHPEMQARRSRKVLTGTPSSPVPIPAEQEPLFA